MAKKLVYAIVFFSFFDLFTQLPIMSPFAQSLGASAFLTGLTVGMFSFSNTIGNVLSGFLTDKKGPFHILVFGLIGSGIILIFYQFASGPISLLMIRFLHGLVSGLIVPAAFTYLANATGREKRGKGGAISGAFIGMAAVIGPAFSGIVASRTGEPAVFAVTAVFMILLGIASFLILRVHPADQQDEREKGNGLTIRRFFTQGEVWKAFLGAFFLMFSQGVLAYMLPLKVIGLGLDSRTSGLLLSTFGLVAIVVFLLPTNRIFDRVQPIYTLSAGMGTMGLSLLLISQSESQLLLYGCLALYGAGFAFLFPSINSLLIDSTDSVNRGRAYGYFYAFFSFGVVIGSGLTGLLELSANGGFIFTGLLLLLAASLFYMRKEKREKATV